MTVELQPLRDQVLVRLRDLPEKTGSIVRVNTLRYEYAREADVIRCGGECRDTNAGDVVLVPALVGQQIGDDQMIPESSILADLSGDEIFPARGVVLVKKVKTQDSLPGGRIVIPEDARERLANYQVHIVAVGLPPICDNPRCIRAHELAEGVVGHAHPNDERLVPGAWAIVRPRSFIPAGIDSEELFFVRTDDVLGLLSAAA